MSPTKILIVVATLLFSWPIAAVHADTLTAAQKTEVQQVVRDYLLKNPEIIAEAITELQRRNEVASAEHQRAAMAAMATVLTSSPSDPVMGNAQGDVTMVEFFDYRCGYCKKVFGDVQTLLKADGHIRLVLKEFPILGDDSVNASRAALAVWLHQPNKYKAFHAAMMLNKGALGKDKVLELAKASGVDVDALGEQMNDPEIDKTFAATRDQAQTLDLNGTPAFIVGETIVPGAIGLDAMKQLVAAARGK